MTAIGAGPSPLESRRVVMVQRAARAPQKKVSQLRKVVLQTRVRPGAHYRRACAFALELPGVEQATSYGTPSLKVKGKFMARLRTEAEGALALRCDFLDRQVLLQSAPDAFFVTDHYLDYPMILVRLDKVRGEELRDLIHRAWRMVAPPKLVAAYDATHEPSAQVPRGTGSRQRPRTPGPPKRRKKGVIQAS
jgi:hypothetical protein